MDQEFNILKFPPQDSFSYREADIRENTPHYEKTNSKSNFIRHDSQNKAIIVTFMDCSGSLVEYG